MKVGGRGENADIDRIKAVREAAPQARLLVDVNDGWTRAQLDACAPALAALGVSVIEQPLAPALLIARHAGIVDLDSPLLLAADRERPQIDLDDLIGWPEAALWG